MRFVKRRLQRAPRWMPSAATALVAVLLAWSLIACGTTGETTDSTVYAPSTSSSTLTAGDGSTATTQSGDDDQGPKTKGEGMVAVIVDLSVEWEPEAQLESEEAVAEQREGIRDAQNAIVELLEDTEFEVTRLYQSTPQMALTVDAEGLDRLHGSVLVENVNEDEPDPPSG